MLKYRKLPAYNKLPHHLTYTHWEVWYSGFQVTGMIEWGQKSKPKKLP